MSEPKTNNEANAAANAVNAGDVVRVLVTNNSGISFSRSKLYIACLREAVKQPQEFTVPYETALDLVEYCKSRKHAGVKAEIADFRTSQTDDNDIDTGGDKTQGTVNPVDPDTDGAGGDDDTEGGDDADADPDADKTEGGADVTDGNTDGTTKAPAAAPADKAPVTDGTTKAPEATTADKATETDGTTKAPAAAPVTEQTAPAATKTAARARAKKG